MEIEALELEGFETTRVRAGADTADVVLLDLGLPDLDGREVCLPVRGRTGGVPSTSTALSLSHSHRSSATPPSQPRSFHRLAAPRSG